MHVVGYRALSLIYDVPISNLLAFTIIHILDIKPILPIDAAAKDPDMSALSLLVA